MPPVLYTKLTALVLLLSVALAHLPVSAATFTREETPEPLRPWLSWVLQKHPTQTCPLIYNRSERWCTWAGTLNLTLTSHGGHFRQEWMVDSTSFVPLPGSLTQWPLHVTRQGHTIPVLERNGSPSIELTPGAHRIEGTFTWEQLPDHLMIPSETGLLALTINGRTMSLPTRDESGRLWLKTPTAGLSKDLQNTEDIHIARYLSDTIPFTVITHIDLNISGEPRELLLGRALLPDFIPLNLTSALPSRLEADGHIRTQLRPGHWTIDLTARAPGPLNELTLPAQGSPWSAQGEEFWSVELHPELRVIELLGLEAIDPKTASIPNEWGKQPTYRIMPGQRLHFLETRRGDTTTSQDQINLHRDAWLDFSGTALTTHDRLTGTISQTWRLTALPETRLGQVSLNGEPQFITTTSALEAEGVEIRRGHIQVSADSRIQHPPTELSATGWDIPIHLLTSTLHLPPGWSVFHAWGPDRTSHTWISQWTLFDSFLVLILTIATAQLYSWKTGLTMGAMLLLTYHEHNAPHYLWASILVTTAILKGFPHGKIHTVATTCRMLIWLLIALTTVPFTIQAIRTGLYPQLLYPGYPTDTAEPAADTLQHDMRPNSTPELKGPLPLSPEPRAPESETPTLQHEERMNHAMRAQEDAVSPQHDVTRNVPYASTSRYVDTERTSGLPASQSTPQRARVQTGPGLPTWRYNSASFSWNGPVQPSETLSLWLISPRIQLWINLASVALIGTLLAQLCLNLPWPQTSWRSWFTRSASLPIILLSLLTFGLVTPSHATSFPPDALLTELEARVTKLPACHPECVTIARAHLSLQEQRLQIRLESHSTTESAVPLPGRQEQWDVTQIKIGNTTPPLARDKNGTLWITVPAGTHDILMEGQLPNLRTTQLTFPLQPHHVTADSAHWTINGIHPNHTSDRTLQFVRLQPTATRPGTAEHGPSSMPPFLLITRTLIFDLTWHMITTVQRLSPPEASIVESIPLLPGESITSEHIKTKQGRAVFQLAPNQTSLQWESILAITSPLTLTAATQQRYVETWQLQISPIWHPSITGIPAVHHRTSTDNLFPTYHPWPGESITVTLSKPEAVDGPTLTIDRSHLIVTTGTRTTESTLKFTIRSSQGGQHTIRLPEHSTLNTVTINGQSLPLQLDDRTVRLPIRPGSQIIHLAWQEPRGIDTIYHTSAIDLGAPSVNHHLSLNAPQDRWPLALHGPGVGPAILYWGVLLIIVLGAIGLSRIPASPLSFLEWVLLGIGLSLVPFAIGLPVILWILAMQGRRTVQPDLMRPWQFNLMQIGLLFLTLLALGCLGTAIQHGLLGAPDMSIEGNGSTATQLRWYVDQADTMLPTGTIVSVSIYWFRGLMLLWSLWMAVALIRWLKQSYTAFTTGGYWKGGSPLSPNIPSA